MQFSWIGLCWAKGFFMKPLMRKCFNAFATVLSVRLQVAEDPEKGLVVSGMAPNMGMEDGRSGACKDSAAIRYSRTKMFNTALQTALRVRQGDVVS